MSITGYDIIRAGL